jgi:hypothetical protein
MPTRKLDAGNPHVRFDEGEGSYRTLSTLQFVLVLGFSWVGAKISKIENPSAALAIPTWPHRECKPQEQRISTTS